MNTKKITKKTSQERIVILLQTQNLKEI